MKVCAECKFCVVDAERRRLGCTKRVDRVTGAPLDCVAERCGSRGCGANGADWEAREDGGKLLLPKDPDSMVEYFARQYEVSMRIGIALGAFCFGGLLGLCV